jgi:hypothetical protein
MTLYKKHYKQNQLFINYTTTKNKKQKKEEEVFFLRKKIIK